MKKELIEQGVHNYTEEEQYIIPEEKEVQEKIKWFMGLKLGLMIHWGPGGQLGTFESWPLSDGDGSWSQSEIDWTDIKTFKKQYIEANKTFHPVKFRPDRVAKLAKDCGFKYLLFTTKHHDGFCMFDTKTTEYKITDPSCPFHTHPYANVTKELYQAARKEGLAISTYFSKPDWHSDFYWRREFGDAPTCNVNYDIEKYPDLWQQFVAFTHEQIHELCVDYGPVDVLWLDGGWVSPTNRNQDIHLEELIPKLRKKNPGLIVCDRTAGGKYENIVTPEKTVPENALSIPWETCTTIGKRFAFLYTDTFKTATDLVHLLLEVAAKGGNLALNIALQPDGAIPAPAIASMQGLGKWLNIFGEGIYNTHTIVPYFEESVRYTAKEEKIYAFYLYEDGGKIPDILSLHLEAKIRSITSMRTGENIPFAAHEGRLLLLAGEMKDKEGFYAEGFEILL